MKKLEEGVKRSTKVVNGIEVPILRKEIIDANSLYVEAGTTGFKGGDSGHGGRTFFLLHNAASTDIEIDFLPPDGVAICLGGDSELRTFIEALEFAADTLRKQAEYGDTKADIMTQLQKASKTVLEISAKNKELMLKADALQVEVNASKVEAIEFKSLAVSSRSSLEGAMDQIKEDGETIRALQKEVYDSIPKMAGLRYRVIMWKTAFFTCAAISIIALLLMTV